MVHQRRAHLVFVPPEPDQPPSGGYFLSPLASLAVVGDAVTVL